MAGLVLSSCYKDKGNYDYTAMPPIEIGGIESSYLRYAVDDRLVITPQIADEGKYDFCWEIYEDYRSTHGNIPEADTIARTKNLDLDLNFTLPAGGYVLGFKATDKSTKYTEIVYTKLTVTTLNMNGWYFTKQIGDETDMDFYYQGGKIENWMAAHNDGYRLQGSPRETIILSNYKEASSDTQVQTVLLSLSDRDASIFRLTDGGLSRDFNRMFFNPPAERNVQGCVTDMNFSTLSFLINNGIYTMSLGSFYGGGYLATPALANGNSISHAAIGFGNIICFDDNSKSFRTTANYTVLNERPESPISCNNMNADLLWLEGYQSPRMAAMALIKTLDSDVYTLIDMSITYPTIGSNLNPINQVKTLPAGSKLPHANARGGHFDFQLVYFADGADVYMHDFQSSQETLLFSAPAGETVTHVQHIKYPLNPASGASYTNCLVVASHKDGRYKVWVFDLETTGGITAAANTPPTYEGEGLVKCATYLETGNGSWTYF